MTARVRAGQSIALLADIRDGRGQYRPAADIDRITITSTDLYSDQIVHDSTLVIADVWHDSPQTDAVRWKRDEGFNLDTIAPGSCWPYESEFELTIVVYTKDAQVLPAVWEFEATPLHGPAESSSSSSS